MEIKEQWKVIDGCEGRYIISDRGRVASLNYRGTGKTQILTSQVGTTGYPQIRLRFNNELKAKNYDIHRLVAKAFIANPKNLPQVNHKDEDSLNNYASNLEWCTQSYNNSYGSRTFRASSKCNYKAIGSKLSKRVRAKDASGNIIYEFSSTVEAGRHGFTPSGVGACCRGVSKTHKGLLWEYV